MSVELCSNTDENTLKIQPLPSGCKFQVTQIERNDANLRNATLDLLFLIYYF